MMNRLLRILLLIPTLYLVLIPVYFLQWHYSKPCRGMEITIVDSSRYHFVTRRDIQNTIISNNGSIVGKPVKEIRVSEIENTMGDTGNLRQLKCTCQLTGSFIFMLISVHP